MLAAWSALSRRTASPYSLHYKHRLTWTRPVSAGASTSGRATVAVATGEAGAKTAIATAIANSRLFP